MNGQLDLFSFIQNDEPIEQITFDLSPKKEVIKPTTKPTKVKGNVIEFPGKKPELAKVTTKGNATYDDCKAKMDIERKKYSDSDNGYVIDGILELCKVDQEFRNNLMRDSKTYDGFFKYMFDCASKGYCYKSGNVGTMTNDMALGLALDYYNGTESRCELWH